VFSPSPAGLPRARRASPGPAAQPGFQKPCRAGPGRNAFLHESAQNHVGSSAWAALLGRSWLGWKMNQFARSLDQNIREIIKIFLMYCWCVKKDVLLQRVLCHCNPSTEAQQGCQHVFFFCEIKGHQQLMLPTVPDCYAFLGVSLEKSP